MEDYIVLVETEEIVKADSPEEAARVAVGQAYRDKRIPNEVVVEVRGHGKYRVKNRRSVEYDRGDIRAPIDVSDLSAAPVAD